MKTVVIIKNPLETGGDWETFQVAKVGPFLLEHFRIWPENARLYHGQVVVTNDITPVDDYGIDSIEELEGPFFVVIYPGDVFTIIAIVAVVVAVAFAFIFRPRVPTPAIRNKDSSSPNNDLSDRQNTARVNGRIPDIYGTVRSIPDLIAVPYRTFVNNEEIEDAYMCIGRGYFDIDDIRDGSTPIGDIPGMTVEVYEPGTRPGNDSPSLIFGDAISTPLAATKRYSGVNGQVLRPPNSSKLIGKSNIYFSTPNKIQASTDSEIDFTTLFESGDPLVVERASYGPTSRTQPTLTFGISGSDGTITYASGAPGSYAVGQTINIESCEFWGSDGGNNYYTVNLQGLYVITAVNGQIVTLQNPSSINPDWTTFGYLIEGPFSKATYVTAPTGAATLNLNGNYIVSSVSAKQITLSSPQYVNSGWNTLINSIHTTPMLSSILSASGSRWVGPFTLDDTTLDKVIANFVAPSGLYADDGTNSFSRNVDVGLEIVPINADGTERGPKLSFSGTLEGSAIDKHQRAITIVANVNSGPDAFTGRCRVRALRLSDSDKEFNGTVVDEVRWRDVYSSSPVTASDFGDVTTVRALTYATTGALAVKERKLNMLVTRKIPQRISGLEFSSTLYPTNQADEIISAICLDPKIGNRSLAELDFDSIYTTIDTIQSYFGTAYASEFSYTFDKDNLSFEEILSSVAGAIFSIAYRRGNLIKLTFEKATPDSTLLFNHRNKIPGTEVRTARFGYPDDQNGVEFEWVDPIDDALVTFYVPEDKSATNPKRIESIGIRTKIQARFHAYRAFNKMKWQNIVVEFEATQEADLLLLQDRILNADNTRPGSQDGEVLSQDGLTLTLSQSVTFAGGVSYVIFLQYSDGTVESISIVAGAQANKVVLATAPRVNLVTDDTNFARTTYMIVGNNDTQVRAFLVTEKQAKNNMTSTVQVVNYDARYYTNDLDVINHVVDENGN